MAQIKHDLDAVDKVAALDGSANACADKPCLNGGKCLSEHDEYSGLAFKCKCTKAWSGVLCGAPADDGGLHLNVTMPPPGTLPPARPPPAGRPGPVPRPCSARARRVTCRGRRCATWQAPCCPS